MGTRYHAKRQDPLRVFISVDIEGIAGVTSRNHRGADGIDYARARDWMTRTAVVAAESALEAGADQVVVSDGHGRKENIDVDRLPRGVRLVRGSLRPLGMMQGIEAGPFGAAFLLGYHAGASAMGGVLAHTNTGAVREIRLNGQVANEAVFNAAVAGSFGVPIVLTSGDNVFAAEMAPILPGVECVVVQTSHGALAATCMAPAEAEAAIRAAVPRALTASIAPFVLEPPLQVEIDFKHRMPAEILAYAPWFTRPAASTIGYTAESAPQACSILAMLLNYSAGLTG